MRRLRRGRDGGSSYAAGEERRAGGELIGGPQSISKDPLDGMDKRGMGRRKWVFARRGLGRCEELEGASPFDSVWAAGL